MMTNNILLQAITAMFARKSLQLAETLNSLGHVDSYYLMDSDLDTVKRLKQDLSLLRSVLKEAGMNTTLEELIK